MLVRIRVSGGSLMTLVNQLEVLDIRHYTARQLRPLLEHEAAAWEKRLHWNYRSSTELLLQYLDARVLPGFVALDRGKICGFTFCVYEGEKAVVGDAYAVEAPASGLSGLAIARTLLLHLLEVLLHAPTAQRIESQLLLHDEGAITEIFARNGFSIFPRLFMECNLDRSASCSHRLAPPGHSVSLPGNMTIQQWSNIHYQASAALIHESYLGHLDSDINDQYRTLHGSLRFLHNIVRFPGCGIFEESLSWLLIDSTTNKLAGLVLCSRVADRVAHITQLCVAPGFRGKGLARLLMRHAVDHLAQARFDAITLTVTEANEDAVRLYRDMRFVTSHRFDAMVLDKPRPSRNGTR